MKTSNTTWVKFEEWWYHLQLFTSSSDRGWEMVMARGLRFCLPLKKLSWYKAWDTITAYLKIYRRIIFCSRHDRSLACEVERSLLSSTLQASQWAGGYLWSSRKLWRRGIKCFRGITNCGECFQMSGVIYQCEIQGLRGLGIFDSFVTYLGLKGVPLQSLLNAFVYWIWTDRCWACVACG